MGLTRIFARSLENAVHRFSRCSSTAVKLKVTLPTEKDGSLYPQPIDHADLSIVDDALYKNMFPFQKEGVKEMVEMGGRVLLGDDMGLGKTIQALGAASYYRNEWPLLIVCPAFLRLFWAECIGKWLPSIERQDIIVIKTGTDEIPESGRPFVVITSYALMVALQERLIKQKFKVVIMDESHMINHFHAQRTKVAIELLKASSRAFLLSGTPSLTTPIDLHMQISCLRPGLLGTRAYYRRLEKQSHKVDYYNDFAEHVRDLLSSVLIRRTKSEVLTQLPKKTRSFLEFDISTSGDIALKLEQTRLEFDALYRENLKKFGETELAKSMINNCLFSFYELSARAKFEAVKQYVLDLLQKHQHPKFVVFSYHLNMVHGLSAALNSINVKHIKIMGATKESDRQDYIAWFQADPECRVAVLSMRAAGHGITLTSANLGVFAELYWNPGNLVQAEDRLYRIGQEKNVQVHYLFARGTIDDYIRPIIKRKLDSLHQIGISMPSKQFEENAA